MLLQVSEVTVAQKEKVAMDYVKTTIAESIKSVLGRMDMNGDGILTFSEFETILKPAQSACGIRPS